MIVVSAVTESVKKKFFSERLSTLFFFKLPSLSDVEKPIFSASPQTLEK